MERVLQVKDKFAYLLECVLYRFFINIFHLGLYMTVGKNAVG
jgi:hypothetical protein